MRIRTIIAFLLFAMLLAASVPASNADQHNTPQTVADCAGTDGAGLDYLLVANDLGMTTADLQSFLAIAHDPSVAFQIVHERAGVTAMYRGITGAHFGTGIQWEVWGNRNKGYVIEYKPNGCQIYTLQQPFRFP